MTVEWLKSATDALLEIADRIALDKPTAADQLILHIEAATARLADFPRLGRVVPEYSDDDLRELIVGSYRVVYRVEKTAVVILTIFEGHRLLPSDE